MPQGRVRWESQLSDRKWRPDPNAAFKSSGSQKLTLEAVLRPSHVSYRTSVCPETHKEEQDTGPHGGRPVKMQEEDAFASQGWAGKKSFT